MRSRGIQEQEQIIVCWTAKQKSVVPLGIEVLVLSESKYNIEVKQPPSMTSSSNERPLYRVIGYNTEVAAGRHFASFEDATIFRANIRFEKNHLPRGSVIVLYEKGHLIGEMTVVKYIFIENPPQSAYEQQLYSLISYPVTIDEELLGSKWYKGHIIYSDFKIYDPSVDFKILNRNMSRGGSLNLTFEELEMIRGRRK